MSPIKKSPTVATLKKSSAPLKKSTPKKASLVTKKSSTVSTEKPAATKKIVVKKTAIKKVTSSKEDKPVKKILPVKKSQPSSKLIQQDTLLLTDDHIDLELFNEQENAKAISKIGLKVTSSVSGCPQGKQPKVIRDNCKLAPPMDKNKYISELHVTLSTQNLKITWSDGKVENWLCSPNPKLTPVTRDVVGMKCGAKHTNYKRDGMAWFTAFKSRGMAYGFHNSQPVGKGIYSHGCVRVVCAHAKIINQNSWSGKTVIRIVK